MKDPYNGKNIIIAEISSGKQKPYYIKQDGITEGVYVRVSGTSRKADRSMTQELYYESEGRSYDTVICRDVTISDDEIEKFCRDMKQVALSKCKNDEQRENIKDVTKNVLLNWGVLAEAEGGSIHPTNAYIFLTGQDAFLSKIQCGMFKGTTRAVFVDKRDYEGPLWKQAEEAFQFVLRNIRLGAKIEGLYRRDIYELPPTSIRELIINSLMNCSFLQSSHIQVVIFDDRLEITSPGGLMLGVTIERMKEGYSQIRNRALAHAFSYMNVIEGWGTGIPRLLREMKEYGLPDPEFVDMEIALRINLYRGQMSVQPDCESSTATNTNQETDQETNQETNQEISQEEKIVNEIRKNPEITQEQLAEKMGLSRSGIRYVMKKLQTEGVLERIGSTKKGQSSRIMGISTNDKIGWTSSLKKSTRILRNMSVVRGSILKAEAVLFII